MQPETPSVDPLPPRLRWFAPWTWERHRLVAMAFLATGALWLTLAILDGRMMRVDRWAVYQMLHWNQSL